MGINRKYLLLGVDLFWVAVSPFAALFLRDNFAPYPEALEAAILYAVLGVVIAAVVFPIAGLNRSLWRYTSLTELMRLQLAVTVTVLLALLATFAHTRLADISRSLPLLQWFFLVAVMTGTRLAIRVWRERTAVPAQQFVRNAETEQVLIVGVNRLAEVYVRAMTEAGPKRFSIAGLLANGTHMHGRLLRSYKVLGVPEDVAKIVQELEVHGTFLNRIVVTEDLRRLSPGAQQALLNLERSAELRIDWLRELLGFGSTPEGVISHKRKSAVCWQRRHFFRANTPASIPEANLRPVCCGNSLSNYGAVFRGDDAIDCDRPRVAGRVLAEQARPLWPTFQVVQIPHDAWSARRAGRSVPDPHRVSKLGALLRQFDWTSCLSSITSWWARCPSSGLDLSSLLTTGQERMIGCWYAQG